MSNRQRGAIGIVGGVGAFAGLELNRKIFQFSAARSDQEYPEVYLLTVPSIPDRSSYLLDQERVADPSEAIIDVVGKLSELQAEVFAIPCNTAHAPAILGPVLRHCNLEGYRVRFIHMIDVTVRDIVENGVRKVGLLATSGTYLADTYTHALGAFDVEVVVPQSREGKKEVHAAVYDKNYGIKTISDPIQDDALRILQRHGDDFIERGAEMIILGCTEISLAGPLLQLSAPLVDPLDLLAQDLLRAVGYVPLGVGP